MTPAPLHILQVTKGLDIGGYNGGSENFGLRLARQLRSMGVQVSLCPFYQYHTPVEAEWVARLTDEGIQVVFANATPRLNLTEGIQNLSRFARDKQVTILHSHFQVGTLAGIAVKRMNGVTLLRTAHTPLEFGNSPIGHIARFLFVQLAYPFLLDTEVGVSAGVVSALDRRWAARLAHQRAHCIYNALGKIALPTPDARPFKEFIEKGTEPPWVLTAIGILNPLKRFDTVLQAMPQILKSIPHARFALVGRGPEESRLQALANELHIADRVWFMGQREDIQAILRHSNVFVQPSQLEALSTVILEAMQNGTPVIASDIPGNRELIEDKVNGLLFPVRDSEALAGRVIQIYRHPEVGQRYAQNAQARLGAFTIESVADQYVQLYAVLAAGRLLSAGRRA